MYCTSLYVVILRLKAEHLILYSDEYVLIALKARFLLVRLQTMAHFKRKVLPSTVLYITDVCLGTIVLFCVVCLSIV